METVQVKTPLYLLCLIGEYRASFKLSVQHRVLQLYIAINSRIHLYLFSPFLLLKRDRNKQIKTDLFLSRPKEESENQN